MLNPKSPLPLYHQLADILTEQIRSGTYQPGDVIPSETRMARQFHIGRPTVRQAVEILVRKGLVERKRGSGTFVRTLNRQVDLFSLAGTSQAFLTKGIKTVSRIITPVSALAVQKDKTNPFNGKTAFFLSRLTLVKADPVILETFYFHREVFLGLDTMDLENKSLSRVVSDHYYLKPESAQQIFKLGFLSDHKAGLLDLNPADPVLEVERTLNFPVAAGAVFSRIYCRTDTFAFSQTLNLEMTQGG
ncbi:GntR family transcriptional regulator [Desulfobacula sp.]|uniref:GntR family transcriptional regulator n=1 Tax=Desulfobacula sp. TaxID=2593537 RepID=UPI00261A2A3F|nr:GntR family transcriptional regulator [Desulfobacula sp.]